MKRDFDEALRETLDRELAGLTVTPSRQRAVYEYATGGKRMKRRFSTGLAVALILILLAGTALAVALLSAQEVIENTAVPMARENDADWRLNGNFSPEELAAFVRACTENGIELNENDGLMRAFRNGEGYYEEEAIMEVCRSAFGGVYGEWTLAQRHWFEDVMVKIGFHEANYIALPGPDDLSEDEARARMLAALKKECGDLPFGDGARYSARVELIDPAAEDGERWQLYVSSRAEPVTEYRAALDKAGNALYALDVTERREAPARAEPAFALTQEEAARLAAEAIRGETGRDVPLNDPGMYHYFAWKNAEERTWAVTFLSHTAAWGRCEAMVDDATGEATVLSADVYELTADNIMDRWTAEYGPRGDWPQERWVKLREEIADKPAETLRGKILKATPYIPERDGLLTRAQAEEAAFRAAELRHGDVNCAALIDAEPHPLWKMRLLPYEDKYPESFVVEIDAVTGEMTDFDYYKSDYAALEPAWHMYSLRRTWSRLTLAQDGPLPLAFLAVIHRYGDLTFDMPEEYLPIGNGYYYETEIDGLTVRFRSRWRDLPDYAVALDPDGVPLAVDQLPSTAPDALPEGFDTGGNG